MEYVLLTAEKQAELLRNVLLQAEYDNFVHGLEVSAAQSVADAFPAGPDRDAAVQQATAMQMLADAAEKRAAQAKQGLDELKALYVVEVPVDEPVKDGGDVGMVPVKDGGPLFGDPVDDDLPLG